MWKVFVRLDKKFAATRDALIVRGLMRQRFFNATLFFSLRCSTRNAVHERLAHALN
jgi:hypothetical protein